MPGNATDFGDLTAARGYLGGCSSSTRGIFAGGNSPGSGVVNNIEYVTIASPGNSTDFGDLSQVTQDAGACSNAHGGL